MPALKKFALEVAPDLKKKKPYLSLLHNVSTGWLQKKMFPKLLYYLSARSVEQDHHRQVVEALRHSAEQIPSHGRAANPLIQTKTILINIFIFIIKTVRAFYVPCWLKIYL